MLSSTETDVVPNLCNVFKKLISVHSQSLYGNMNSIFCYNNSIVYDVALNYMVAIEVGIFYYFVVTCIKNYLTSNTVFPLCLLTTI